MASEVEDSPPPTDQPSAVLLAEILASARSHLEDGDLWLFQSPYFDNQGEPGSLYALLCDEEANRTALDAFEWATDCDEVVMPHADLLLCRRGIGCWGDKAYRFVFGADGWRLAAVEIGGGLIEPPDVQIEQALYLEYLDAMAATTCADGPFERPAPDDAELLAIEAVVCPPGACPD